MAAARTRLGMSYARVLYLVEATNARFDRPLVAAHEGGKAVGGTKLTRLGGDVLRAFREIEAETDQASPACSAGCGERARVAVATDGGARQYTASSVCRNPVPVPSRARMSTAEQRHGGAAPLAASTTQRDAVRQRLFALDGRELSAKPDMANARGRSGCGPRRPGRARPAGSMTTSPPGDANTPSWGRPHRGWPDAG